MTAFKIAVTSDTVCPWCYVGRRQLQRAQQLWQQKYPDSKDSFSVSYKPYQLNPDATTPSRDKQQFYLDKFGPERTALIHERLLAVGSPLNIHFQFGGKTGNTRDSHRLVQLVKKYGNEVELKTVDGLFAAYFEKEQDITDHETLRAVAVEAGIPDKEFQDAIVLSDEGGKVVDEAVRNARLEGVHGVPDYLIQDKFRINGGQDASVFVKVFERIKELDSN